MESLPPLDESFTKWYSKNFDPKPYYYCLCLIFTVIVLFWLVCLQFSKPCAYPYQEAVFMKNVVHSLPPFTSGYPLFKFVKKYDLALCPIDGNFPHLTTAIMCFLDRPDIYRQKRNISNDVTGFCGNEPPFTLHKLRNETETPKNTTKQIAVVQDPVDRFVRLFHSICVVNKQCYECEDLLGCLLRRAFSDMIDFTVTGSYDGISPSLALFFPQAWYCGFDENLREITIIKYGGAIRRGKSKNAFDEQFKRVMRERNVSAPLIDEVEREIRKVRFALTPEELEVRRKLLENPRLLRLFLGIYRHDFSLFGYTTPPIPETSTPNGTKSGWTRKHAIRQGGLSRRKRGVLKPNLALRQ
ncbi:unnamed protein product [Caenorhabditis auriculariae]|uniref:Uncharacterized protein n=1 Tax=Caenorhabditis auriculariae TaxID=2777116 RepID=A0A8S1HWL3_9PELO|nr:unnamed protein product [Caenorhabditis auriculariae]